MARPPAPCPILRIVHALVTALELLQPLPTPAIRGRLISEDFSQLLGRFHPVDHVVLLVEEEQAVALMLLQIVDHGEVAEVLDVGYVDEDRNVMWQGKNKNN